ncbi:MAG: hypothetical protein K6U14_04350 [Firmicutes bacterium]|nr:hypothetical protein [Alicyclobacillaceae bacterium]MCL6496852.1 hypothetical protein [Bacillota bacterium]
MWWWRRPRMPWWVWLLGLWGFGRWLRWQSLTAGEREAWRQHKAQWRDKVRRTVALWTESDGEEH